MEGTIPLKANLAKITIYPKRWPFLLWSPLVSIAAILLFPFYRLQRWPFQSKSLHILSSPFYPLVLISGKDPFFKMVVNFLTPEIVSYLFTQKRKRCISE